MDFDRFGRYMIPPPDGSKAKPYTRVTTFAKHLEDSYNLNLWHQRMVAVGLSRRPDLVASVSAAIGDRKKLIALCDRAEQAADADAGAEMGDALHSLTEQVDRKTRSLSDVALAQRPDIDAYLKALDAYGFEVELIEQVVVLEGLGLAGRFDRTIFAPSGARHIFDLKTAQPPLYLTAIAIQLALYAHADHIYDENHNIRASMPEVNQEVGYVAHVPAGSGTCEIIGIDLQKGWDAVQLTKAVLGWRKSDVRLSMTSFEDSVRAGLKASVANIVANHGEAAMALAAGWPVGVPTLRENGHSVEQLRDIAAWVRRIEGEYRLPLGERSVLLDKAG